MAKGTKQPTVRLNTSMPESFAKRLEAIKVKRGASSDSEVIRQMIGLMEMTLAPEGSEFILRNKRTGKETVIIVA